MESFNYPTLSVQVGTLDGVPGRPVHRANSPLLPEDVRADAVYQALARRNAALEHRLNHIGRVTMVVGIVFVAFNMLWNTQWMQLRIGQWMASTLTSSATERDGVAKANTLAPLTSSEKAVPAPASRPTPPELRGVDVIASPNGETTPKPVNAIGVPAINPSMKPIAVIAAPTPAQKSAPVAQVAPHLVQTHSDPGTQVVAGQGKTFEIMDFMGANVAVLLSSDGGQTMRSYRAGDTLPNGEVIKTIDSSQGSVTTNQRIIKK